MKCFKGDIFHFSGHFNFNKLFTEDNTVVFFSNFLNMESKPIIEYVQKYYKAEIREVFDEIKKENVQKTFLVCQVEKPIIRRNVGIRMCMFQKMGQGIIVDIFVMSISLNHFLEKLQHFRRYILGYKKSNIRLF